MTINKKVVTRVPCPRTATIYSCNGVMLESVNYEHTYVRGGIFLTFEVEDGEFTLQRNEIVNFTKAGVYKVLYDDFTWKDVAEVVTYQGQVDVIGTSHYGLGSNYTHYGLYLHKMGD